MVFKDEGLETANCCDGDGVSAEHLIGFAFRAKPKAFSNNSCADKMVN